MSLKFSNTLKSETVRDALKELHRVKYKNAVGGGIAVHHYIPEELYRPTSDLDLTTDNSLSLTEFREKNASLISYFENKGAKIKTEKDRTTFSLEILVDEKSNDGLTIQTTRRSKKNIENNKESINHEIENSKAFVRPNKGTSIFSEYKVLRPEDLILRKVCRILEFSRNYNLKMPEARNGCAEKYLNHISEERNSLYNHQIDNVDPREIIKFRLNCDVYDITLLDVYQHLDKAYFEESKSKRMSNCKEDFDVVLKNSAPKLYYKKPVGKIVV